MNKNINQDTLPPSHYLQVQTPSEPEENNAKANPYFYRKIYVITFIAIFGLTLLLGTLIVTAKDTIEESQSEDISTAEEVNKEFCSRGAGSDDIIRGQMTEDFRNNVEKGDTSCCYCFFRMYSRKGIFSFKSK